MGDKWLLLLVAAWVSVAAHGVALVGLTTGLDDITVEVPIELTLVSSSEAATDATSSTERAVEPAREEAGPLSTARESSSSSSAVVAEPAPRGFRARLRALEAAHAARERAAARALTAAGGVLGAAFTTTGSVVRCGARADEPLDRLPVRHLAELSAVLPRGVLPTAYIEETGELGRRRTNEGFLVELALPTGLVAVPFDDPPEAAVVLGRDDVRCAIEIEVTRSLFPMRMRGLPVRFVSGDRVVAEAVVDVRVTHDAAIEILSSTGDPVPFTRATLARRERVAATLQDHASSFSAMVALAELLGGE